MLLSGDHRTARHSRPDDPTPPAPGSSALRSSGRWPGATAAAGGFALLLLACGPSGPSGTDDAGVNQNTNANQNTNTNTNTNQNNNNVPPGCGDGVIQFGELCDNGAANSDTEPDACRTNCQPAGCGDGVIDTGEVCDGQSLGGATCQGQGFDAGDLACSASCELDTSGCTRCGNGACEAGEDVTTCPADCGLLRVAAGGDHSCVLDGGGSVRCWGRNDQGQLGDGTTSQSLAPVVVSGLSDAVDLACGSNHCCAIRAGGDVVCWGDNEAGALGDGTNTDASSPVAVVGLPGAAVSIAAGNEHTCAVMSGSGAVYCWGANYNGQLGNGGTGLSNVPVQVSGLTGASQVTCGAQHTCALVGLAGKCWGAGGHGRLGNDSSASSPVPVNVSGATNFAALAAGGGHTCGILNGTGAVKCWGTNTDGQLGDGNTGVDAWAPVDVTGLTGAVAITAGADHTCVVLSDGTARCWGDGTYGQLGTGSTSDSSTPAAVQGASGYEAAISSSRNHTCVIVGGTGVACWGAGSYGQLGNGQGNDQSSPVSVSWL